MAVRSLEFGVIVHGWVREAYNVEESSERIMLSLCLSNLIMSFYETKLKFNTDIFSVLAEIDRGQTSFSVSTYNFGYLYIGGCPENDNVCLEMFGGLNSGENGVLESCLSGYFFNTGFPFSYIKSIGSSLFNEICSSEREGRNLNGVTECFA